MRRQIDAHRIAQHAVQAAEHGQPFDLVHHLLQRLQLFEPQQQGVLLVVFQAVAAPETLRADAWRRLALYFGIANLIPLLLLLGYGLWRLERPRPPARPLKH